MSVGFAFHGVLNDQRETGCGSLSGSRGKFEIFPLSFLPLQLLTFFFLHSSFTALFTMVRLQVLLFDFLLSPLPFYPPTYSPSLFCPTFSPTAIQPFPLSQPTNPMTFASSNV